MSQKETGFWSIHGVQISLCKETHFWAHSMTQISLYETRNDLRLRLMQSSDQRLNRSISQLRWRSVYRSDISIWDSVQGFCTCFPSLSLCCHVHSCLSDCRSCLYQHQWLQLNSWPQPQNGSLIIDRLSLWSILQACMHTMMLSFGLSKGTGLRSACINTTPTPPTPCFAYTYTTWYLYMRSESIDQISLYETQMEVNMRLNLETQRLSQSMMSSPWDSIRGLICNSDGSISQPIRDSIWVPNRLKKSQK